MKFHCQKLGVQSQKNFELIENECTVERNIWSFVHFHYIYVAIRVYLYCN